MKMGGKKVIDGLVKDRDGIKRKWKTWVWGRGEPGPSGKGPSEGCPSFSASLSLEV